MTEWIDMNDKLPPRDVWVIGWWQNDPDAPFVKGTPFIFMLESIAKDNTIKDLINKVSYWTKLPDPPEVKNEEG